MKINAYSNSDLNMYLGSTYMMYKNKPIKINAMENRDSRNVRMVYYYADTRGDINISSDSLNKDTELDLDPVQLGYYTMDNFVIYLYKYQRSYYKKLVSGETLRSFIPQKKELRSLRKSYDVCFDKLLLRGQEYLSLDEAFEKMQNKKVLSVALHPSYAMVKKGYNKDFVIYYKTDPVITYDGNTLTPLIDECHITKFKLELGL